MILPDAEMVLLYSVFPELIDQTGS